jgi:hypothetical protein
MSSITFGHTVTSVAVNADPTAMWSISGPARGQRRGLRAHRWLAATFVA